MRVENWNGYDIRFVEHKDQWWAVLKDVCDALNLKTKHVSERLAPDMMERLPIESSEAGSNDLRSRGENKTRWMLVVNEIGIYEALFASRRLEARKFRIWTAGVLQKLRSYVGLQGYEAMRLTDEDIQDQIDDLLDDLYWDDETSQLMISITVQGGDVDQMSFDEYCKQIKEG
jgi:prophage antirepressor-like protein